MPTVTTQKRAANFAEEPVTKKPTISIKQTPEEEAKSKDYFQPKLFTEQFKNDLKHQIDTAGPYPWGCISDLIDDELLRNVRKEILKEIHFTKKETDIYKVFQSGDLANLSGLSEELRERLPSLYKVRSALYSPAFRKLISHVTGCGKLSGSKTDISIHLYNKTCHLLTHDDVIGSRRVSFILYMPDPDKTWKPSNGGALRLFDSIVANVPKSDPCAALTPQFNQIAFFKVQPGYSFHDVEEVLASKQRLSLQGWFHIPQPGDDDFIPGEQEKTEAKSTLEQLETEELREYDFPKMQVLTPIAEKEVERLTFGLTKEDKVFLSEFMNPLLLTKDCIEQMATSFSENSVVDIMSFLNEDYAGALKKQLRHFEVNEYPPMPSKEEEVKFPWKLAIPSHKRRYLYIDGTCEQDITTEESIKKVNETYSQEAPNFKLTADIFKLLQNQSPDSNGNEVCAKLCNIASLFKSVAFRKWIHKVTQLKLLKEKILIRRFRPGHDFYLATTLDKPFKDGLLEATLNLTPTVGWENGEWGGYELAMVDEDNKPADDESKLNEDEAAIYRSTDDDASVAYESQATWNKLCLMYRDPSLLKFVKYVSSNAPGSRWDLTGAWTCEDDEDDEE